MDSEVFDVRIAVQRFWNILGSIEYTETYKRTTFTREQIREWRGHPLILRLNIKGKGSVIAGTRGVVEYRPSDPNFGGLDVFCEHSRESVIVELIIEQDYVDLNYVDSIIRMCLDIWPETMVSYK